MTSIRHYKNPNIVKLDGRYKHYPKFKYRIDFDTQGMENWHIWMNLCKRCEETWGKEYEFIGGNAVFAYRKYNENWRTETPKNKYYRYLYLRSEQDLTLMLLVIGG